MKRCGAGVGMGGRLEGAQNVGYLSTAFVLLVFVFVCSGVRARLLEEKGRGLRGRS